VLLLVIVDQVGNVVDEGLDDNTLRQVESPKMHAFFLISDDVTDRTQKEGL